MTVRYLSFPLRFLAVILQSQVLFQHKENLACPKPMAPVEDLVALK